MKAKSKPKSKPAAHRPKAKKRAAPAHVGGADALAAGPLVAGDVSLPPETVKPNPEIPPMTMRDQRIFTDPTRYYPPQAQVQAAPVGFGQDRSAKMAKKMPPWMQSAGDKADLAEDKQDAAPKGKKAPPFGKKKVGAGGEGNPFNTSEQYGPSLPGARSAGLAAEGGGRERPPDPKTLRPWQPDDLNGLPGRGQDKKKKKVGAGGDVKSGGFRPQGGVGRYKGKVGVGAAMGTPPSAARPGKAARAPKAMAGGKSAAPGAASATRAPKAKALAQNPMAQPGLASPMPTKAPSARGMLAY